MSLLYSQKEREELTKVSYLDAVGISCMLLFFHYRIQILYLKMKCS